MNMYEKPQAEFVSFLAQENLLTDIDDPLSTQTGTGGRPRSGIELPEIGGVD